MTERHRQLEALATDEAMGTRDDGGESVFPNGGSAVNCTACARRIIELAGNGEIIGWEYGDNPTSKVAHDSGHDFAIIDNRYLVDAWAKTVECTTDRAVFDLRDEQEVAVVLDLYGDPNSWVKLEYGDDGAWIKADIQLRGANDVR